MIGSHCTDETLLIDVSDLVRYALGFRMTSSILSTQQEDVQMRMGLVVVLLALGLGTSHAQESVQPLGMTIVRPYLTVPDSLGGKTLKGCATFTLTVHDLGTLLNNQLRLLQVSYDGSEPKTIFKDSVAIPCNTHLSPWSPESVRFIPWLREYLARTQFRFCYDPNTPGRDNRVHLIDFDIFFNPTIMDLPGGHAYE